MVANPERRRCSPTQACGVLAESGTHGLTHPLSIVLRRFRRNVCQLLPLRATNCWAHWASASSSGSRRPRIAWRNSDRTPDVALACGSRQLHRRTRYRLARSDARTLRASDQATRRRARHDSSWTTLHSGTRSNVAFLLPGFGGEFEIALLPSTLAVRYTASIGAGYRRTVTTALVQRYSPGVMYASAHRPRRRVLLGTLEVALENADAVLTTQTSAACRQRLSCHAPGLQDCATARQCGRGNNSAS